LNNKSFQTKEAITVSTSAITISQSNTKNCSQWIYSIRFIPCSTDVLSGELRETIGEILAKILAFPLSQAKNL
jgi:hypothetical protein